MTSPTHSPSSAGIVGLFLVLLGAGVILDADWLGRGGLVIAAGVWCVWRGRRHATPESGSIA